MPARTEKLNGRFILPANGALYHAVDRNQRRSSFIAAVKRPRRRLLSTTYECALKTSEARFADGLRESVEQANRGEVFPIEDLLEELEAV